MSHLITKGPGCQQIVLDLRHVKWNDQVYLNPFGSLIAINPGEDKKRVYQRFMRQSDRALKRSFDRQRSRECTPRNCIRARVPRPRARAARRSNAAASTGPPGDQTEDDGDELVDCYGGCS